MNLQLDPEQVVMVSTKPYQYFAELLAQKLGIPYGKTKVFRQRFSDGEGYLRAGIGDRNELAGKDVIIVGGGLDSASLLEVVRLGNIFAPNTRKRIFVNPYQAYSTMERAKKPGESVNDWLYNIYYSIPNNGLGNAFMFLDLHEEGQLNSLKRDRQAASLYAEPVMLEAIRGFTLPEVFGTADTGRPDWVKSYADKFGVEIAMVAKDRDFETTKLMYSIGNVEGKVVWIYDDMIRSFGTAELAVNAYLNRGAKAVYMASTHMTLNNGKWRRCLDRLEHSKVAHVITTNSHPVTQKLAVCGSKKITVVDVSGVFVEPILALLR